LSDNNIKFLELLKPDYNDAVKYCRALCAHWSADDAEDLLQQSLLQALENFDRLNDITKFRSWFFKIITRTFYSYVRKHFWKKFLPIDNYSYISEMPEIYDRTEQNDNKFLLQKALRKLSAKERAAILLFEIGGFSIEEITNIQNEKSQSAVKSRLSRTRTKLKKYITGIENQHPLQQNSTPLNFLIPANNFSGDEFDGNIQNETLNLIAEAKTKK
jgi:RNA polymerase sigma-70 factor (ECF subfamily)